MRRLSGPAITFWVVFILSFLSYVLMPVGFVTGNLGNIVFSLLPALIIAAIAYLIAKGISWVAGKARRSGAPPAA